MAASSSSKAISSTWYTSIDLDVWFPSMSAISQAVLEIGGVVSPKEGLVVGRDVVKDDDETEAGAGEGLVKRGCEIGRDVLKDDDETEAGAGRGLLKLGREITKDSRLDEVCSDLLARRTLMNCADLIPSHPISSMAASSSSKAISSTWYTSIDLDVWFPSISAIRQAALEIGGVVSPPEPEGRPGRRP